MKYVNAEQTLRLDLKESLCTKWEKLPFQASCLKRISELRFNLLPTFHNLCFLNRWFSPFRTNLKNLNMNPEFRVELGTCFQDEKTIVRRL